MSLWFGVDNQIEILQGYLPVGRIYKKAYSKGSTFYNIIRWQATSFGWLVGRFNTTLKGMYICSDETLLDKWKADYSIPNETFYEGDENRKDVFALKYLMRGNKEWNFRAVANLYGIEVVIGIGLDENGDDAGNAMTVSMLGLDTGRIPHELPHILGNGLAPTKVMKMYAMMKQAQCRIIYRTLLPTDPKPKPMIKFCAGLTDTKTDSYRETQ